MDAVELLPHQLGWLRRKELERITRPTIQVWELPDGQIKLHDSCNGQLRIIRLRNSPVDIKFGGKNG